MVADDPESFADLDGHCSSQSGGGPESCTSRSSNHGLQGEGYGDGNSGIAALECAMESCTTSAEVSAQTTEIANQQQASANANQQPAQQQNNRTGYDTQDQAAAAALRNSNGASISKNKEYAGLIYKDREGRYHYTGPIGGTDQGSNPHDAKAPRGVKVVGDYHTHGDYSVMGEDGRAVRTHDSHRDDSNSNHFSGGAGGDREGIAHDARGKPEYRGYLGTPNGRFLKYNPFTGQETHLQ